MKSYYLNTLRCNLGGLAILAGTGFAVKNCIYTVDAGHRALLFNKITGLKTQVYTEGTHFKVPILHRPILFDVRTKPRQLTSLTGSRDLQMVNITCRVLSKPNEHKLPYLYRRLGLEYDEKVLPSIINEVLKSVVAQYNAAQLITQRELVSRSVREQLVKRANEFGIVLDDVSLTHLSFSTEYEKAVESKQVAQQQAEKAKYIVQKALEEKKSIIIKARGEQEAARLIGEAVKENPGFLELRRLECARDVSNVLSQSSNKLLLNANSLLLDIMKENA